MPPDFQCQTSLASQTEQPPGSQPLQYEDSHCSTKSFIICNYTVNVEAVGSSKDIHSYTAGHIYCALPGNSPCLVCLKVQLHPLAQGLAHSIAPVYMWPNLLCYLLILLEYLVHSVKSNGLFRKNPAALPGTSDAVAVSPLAVRGINLCGAFPPDANPLPLILFPLPTQESKGILFLD